MGNHGKEDLEWNLFYLGLKVNLLEMIMTEDYCCYRACYENHLNITIKVYKIWMKPNQSDISISYLIGVNSLWFGDLHLFVVIDFN